MGVPLHKDETMAVPKIFTEKIDSIKGLRANEDYTIFFYRFKINGKEFTKTIDFSKKTWSKRERMKNILIIAHDFREQKEKGINNLFDPDTKLDDIAAEYFKSSCTESEWNTQRKNQYKLHVKKHIGNKAVGRIIKNDIDKIRSSMEKKGLSKQNLNGCSHRTIQKVLNQILKPILVYAQENGAIDSIPSFTLPKEYNRTRKKKKIKDGMVKLATLYKVIMTRYKDDPFYRALFLFALHGRRWNEIRTLTWENVSLEDGYYTIVEEHNKIGEDQEYELWEPIRESLSHMEDSRGLIFKSPVTGRELDSPKRQLAHVRMEADIPELTMHLFRHIHVTALGENGVAGSILSAALGHTNSETVDRFYRTVNHLKGSKSATIALSDIVDVEAIE